MRSTVVARAVAGLAAGLLAVTGGGAALGATGQRAPQAAGTPGYCPTAEGVTVVVDFQELGGGIVVRCAPGPVVAGYTGLDALRDAGFDPVGTRRYGLAFVCRIAGKPAPDQVLPIDGDPNYREACIDTPPPSAFWSYWYAPNKGSWTYSQGGASNHDPIPGGFEGWSFSLNHTEDGAPPPGIAPTRPPHPRPTKPPHPTPTTQPPTSRPPTTRPPTTGHPTTRPPSRRPPSHRAAPTHAPIGAPAASAVASATATAGGHTTTAGAGPSRHHTGSAGAPRSTSASSSAPTVADPVAVGHNAAGVTVSGQLPRSTSRGGHGSIRAFAVGLGLVAALAVAASIAAWRRRAGPG
jgi:hypothetical protein